MSGTALATAQVIFYSYEMHMEDPFWYIYAPPPPSKKEGQIALYMSVGQSVGLP